MKREQNQTVSLKDKILKLKQSYLLGKYDELIIHDEYIYPPIQKDVKEILISQFGISLLDEYIRNSSQEKLNKKNKFPLPIIFAFIHHHLKANKYQNLVRIIMQHVDRKTVEHYHLLLYIIAKIYEKYKDYKKSIFYLQSLLKESPFFSQGVYDLCFHYALSLQREVEACNILERHINHGLPNEKYIHSLYIYICSKFKLKNSKEVTKNLHNKSMNLVAYFNLGLYLRQSEEFDKSYEIFNQIVTKLSQAKKEGQIFTEKDDRLLLLAKINMLIILRNHNIFQDKNEQQYQKLYQEFLADHKNSIDSETIRLLSQSQPSLSSQPSQKSQKIFKNFRSSRKQKDFSLFNQEKQEKTLQIEEKSIQNKQNQKIFNSTAPNFSTIRAYNNKKLKYLLQKQKQINHFFKNIVIKRADQADKVQVQYKIKDNLLKEDTNESSINKTKILNNHQYQFFQKQFQDKRKGNDLKFDNIELEAMLTQIMTNFDNCVTNNKSQKKIATITKNYSPSPKKIPQKQVTQQKVVVSPNKPPTTSQCNRSTLKEQKRSLMSQGSNRALKSDRSSLFRVKMTSKQPKQLKQPKIQIKEVKEIKEPKILPKISKFQQSKQPIIEKKNIEIKAKDEPQVIERKNIELKTKDKPRVVERQPQVIEKKNRELKTKDEHKVIERKNIEIKTKDESHDVESKAAVEVKAIKKQQVNYINEDQISSFLQANNSYVLSKLQAIISESNDHKPAQNQQYELLEKHQEEPQITPIDSVQGKKQNFQVESEEEEQGQNKVSLKQLKMQQQVKQQTHSVDPIEQEQHHLESETMIIQKKFESQDELPQQPSAPKIDVQTFKIIVNQPADESPTTADPKKQTTDGHADIQADSKEKMNTNEKAENNLSEIPILKQKKKTIQQVKAPLYEPEPQPAIIKTPTYDPFASSFQLTGFGKTSLSKFRDLKKKRVTDANQEAKNEQLPIIIKKDSSKKHEQPKSDVPLTQFQQQLKEGQDLEQAGQTEKAYQHYTKLYKVYKKQTEKQAILIKIGNLFERQEKYAEAEKTYMKCTKFNNVEAFLKLGALLLKNGRINSGVENIEKANCIKRNDIQIENKLVYGYSLKEETMEKALNLAHLILRKQPESLETLIITANILQKQGKIKEAIEIMTAIDKFKSAEYIKHYLGILYLQDSNLTEAFNFFKAALNIKADYLPSLIEVATIISQISPKQSIQILKKVLEIQPHNRKALARLGKIYESIQNDFQSAMVSYQTALQTQQNYESYMKIGDCLAKQQSYIEALINYKEALNLKKTHEAYAKIAHMFEMKEEFTKAIENYEQALGLLIIEKDYSAFKRKEYLTYLGKLSLRVGNYDGGIKFFEEIEDYDDSIDILKLLAEAYFGKKQYSSSLERYQKASEIAKGQNLQILQNIAVCFDRMQEYLASKAIYERILQKDPENIRCINNLANILLITGETNESFYLFESMLQKVPKNLEKRLKVADIYAEVGDWSKVEFHLQHCLRIKENDERVIQRLINLYKQKRDVKMANKYQKKLIIIRNNRKGQQKSATVQ